MKDAVPVSLGGNLQLRSKQVLIYVERAGVNSSELMCRRSLNYVIIQSIVNRPFKMLDENMYYVSNPSMQTGAHLFSFTPYFPSHLFLRVK